MLRLQWFMCAAALGAAAVWAAAVSAEDVGPPTVWTLEASVQRAFEAAPETRAAEAQQALRAGELRQASDWPNPAVAVRADERLGLEDGRGGSDLTQVSISQPLPLRRLARERRRAEARLAAADAQRQYARLLLEYQTAQAYHALQLASAHHDLAHERHDQMEALVSGRDALVRYLAPAERLRLTVLREQASQAIASAEGEYSEAAARLRALLALSPADEPRPAALEPAPAPAALDTLLTRLPEHPALAAVQQEQTAARAGIEAARSQRFADPVVTLFRETDYLGGARRDYNGIGLSVQIPLWNTNNGGVARARAEADIAQAQLAAQTRDLNSRLRKSHLHLGHLIEQAGHQRERVLAPGRRLLDLTRRSFAAGEVNVLALVDAHDSYYNARTRHLELLAQQWLELAELRLAAGVSVAAATEVMP